MRKIVAALAALGMGAAIALPISGAAVAADSHITITVDDESTSGQSGEQKPYWKVPEGTSITFAIAGCTPGGTSSTPIPHSTSEMSLDLSIVANAPSSTSAQSGNSAPSASSTFNATIDIRDDGSTAVRSGNAGTGSFAAATPSIDPTTGNLIVTITGLAPGTYSIPAASCQAGGKVFYSSEGTIEVYAQPERAAALELSTQSATPGQVVTAQGTGFTANEVVTFTAPGFAPVTGIANDEGAVSAELTIPSTQVGPTVTVTATGEKSGRTASADLTMSTPTAPQSGADQAQSVAADAAQSSAVRQSPSAPQSGPQSGAVASAQSGHTDEISQSEGEVPAVSDDEAQITDEDQLSGEVIRPATSLARSEEATSSNQEDLATTGASGLPMLGLAVIFLGGVGTAVLSRRTHRR
ncbi:MAG: hypothetical protein Q4C87_09035 [Actinomycetaceae bacterium]|nr:hypothetical protein [Actinomycetaceae bacterium]